MRGLQPSSGRRGLPPFVVAALFVLFGLAVLGRAPVVHAASSTTVDSTWCGSVGGTWLPSGDALYTYTSGTPTCSLYNSGPGFYTVSGGDTLTVPSGTALELTAMVIYNQGVLQNDGTIMCLAYGSINGTGTINNDGHIEFVGNAFQAIAGVIDSKGYFYNYGTIGDEFPGYGGIYNRYYFYNYGSDSTPISSKAGSTLVNEPSGQLTGATFDNDGTMDNLGTMKNANLNNYNDGTMDNTGTMGAYVYNQGGTFTNYNSLVGGFENQAGTINDYGYMEMNYVANSFSYNYAVFNVYQNGVVKLTDQCDVYSTGYCSEVYLENDGAINLYGYLDDSAGLYLGLAPGIAGIDNRPGAVITISAGGVLDSYGTFYNQGRVDNAGTINSESGYQGSQYFSCYAYCGSAYFQNVGTIRNGGTLNVLSGAAVFSSGGIVSTSKVEVSGDLNITGSLSNSGRIDVYGRLNSTSTASFFETGTLDVFPSGHVLNSGTTDIYSSGALANSGTLDNPGTLRVYGSGSVTNSFFFNAGKIHNRRSGYIDIGTDGILSNSGGSLYNDGLLYNGGTVSSGGTFVNECDGQLTGAVNYAYTSASCAEVQVSLSTAGSAPQPVFQVGGCDAVPATITADGAPVTVKASASCTLSFAVPADGSVARYRFSDSGSPATGWSFTTCASGTCPPEANTVYYQVKNAFSASMAGGNPPSGATVALVGSFLGSSNANVLTLDAGGVPSVSANAWTDYGSAVTFPTGVATGLTNERWATASTVVTPALDSGGGSFSASYTHQLVVGFGYGDQDSSAIPGGAAVGSYLQFGTELPIRASSGYGLVSPAQAWVDAGTGAVTYATYNGGATERWALASSPQSFGASSPTSLVDDSYFHQFDVSFGYSTSDGSTLTSQSSVVSYAQFGAAQHLSTDAGGSLSHADDWADAGTAVTFVSPLTAAAHERYQVSPGDSGFDTVVSSVSGTSLDAAASYFHQFLQTLSYSVVGGGSPAAPSAQATQFGASYAPTLTQAPTGHWFDSAGSIAFANPISGGTGERWAASPQSVSATQPNDVLVSYYHQYQVSFAYVVAGGAGASSAPTVTYGSLGSATTCTAPCSAYADASGYSYTNPLSGSTPSQRWKADALATGTVTGSGEISPSYYHQLDFSWTFGTQDSSVPTPSPSLSGTQFGRAAVDSTGQVWLDAGTLAQLPTTVPLSPSSERWAVIPGESASAPYDGVVSITVSSSSTSLQPEYFHQYLQTVSYSVSDSSSPSAPSYTANRGGSPAAQTLSSNPTGYWFDAGSGWSVTATLGGATSSNERWALHQAGSGTVSSAATDSFAYFHQFLVTWDAVSQDGSTPSPAPALSGTAFGSPATDSTGASWLDAGTSASLPGQVSASSTERWATSAGEVALPGYSASTAIASVGPSSALNVEYYHQYSVGVEYSISGGGSGFSDPVVAYYHFGSSATVNAAQSSPPSEWVDAATTLAYSNPLGGSSTSERWYAPAPTFAAGSSSTLDPAYAHQYYIGFETQPAGYGQVSPSAPAWYDAGSTVDLGASGSAPYSFQYWSVSCVEGTACLPLGAAISANPNSVTVDGAGTVTANFLVPTSVSYSGDTAGQYGDTATLSATLTDSLNGVPLEGQTVAFEVGAQTATATTDASGVATATITLTQGATTASVQASFAGDHTYAGTSDSTAFKITQEDASLSYTGDSILMTTSGSLTLRGTVAVDDASAGGDADAFGGQVTNAVVSFTIFDSGSSQVASFQVPVTCTGANPCEAGAGSSTYPGVGSALLSLSCTETTNGASCAYGDVTVNLGEGSYDVRVGMASGNRYFASSFSDSTLTVYQPDGAFATGGGWVTDPAAVGGQHQGHFSFVVRFDQHGNNEKVQGQSMYIYTGHCDQAGYTDQLCDYIIRSNSWVGGGFAISTNHQGQQCVAMQSKSNVQEILASTGVQIFGEGNDQLTVNACAGGSNSSPPGTYSMTDIDASGVVYHSTSGVSPSNYLGGGSVAVKDQ